MKLRHAMTGAVLAIICLIPIRSLQGQAQAPPARMPLAQMQPPQMANAPKVFYVDIVGQKQKQFRAEIPATGVHKGTIEGVKFSFQMTSPRDLATGIPSGKRQYSAITFTKEWGPSSPQIFEACATNETLTTVTLEFVKVGLDRKELVYQTIKLTNATISSVRRYIGISTGSEPPDPRELEDVSFTFQKIEFHDATGTMAMDDWVSHL